MKFGSTEDLDKYEKFWTTARNIPSWVTDALDICMVKSGFGIKNLTLYLTWEGRELITKEFYDIYGDIGKMKNIANLARSSAPLSIDKVVVSTNIHRYQSSLPISGREVVKDKMSICLTEDVAGFANTLSKDINVIKGDLYIILIVAGLVKYGGLPKYLLQRCEDCMSGFRDYLNTIYISTHALVSMSIKGALEDIYKNYGECKDYIDDYRSIVGDFKVIKAGTQDDIDVLWKKIEDIDDSKEGV